MTQDEDDKPTPPLGTNIHALTSGEQVLGLVQRCLELISDLTERVKVLEMRGIGQERDTKEALQEARKGIEIARKALAKVNAIER